MALERPAFWFVPHTHWDREWYLSFQDFRWKLLKAMDEILDTLASEPGFEHFLLDGQTILLEDYLEVRPDRRQELEKLVRAGRLAVGPWYAQPDDVLVTGEALVRNLERGIRMAESLGGVMRVGYLPDSFGHCAGLPAILKGFGIESACLMRGPGPGLDKAFFHWSARDGSRVLVAFLVDSYGNGADLVMEPAALVQGLALLEERQGEALVPGVPILVMNGMDHRSISRSLPRVLEEAGLRERSRIGSLPGYIDSAAPGLAGIPAWTGELRSPWRFPVNAGCTSSRSGIKQEDQAVSTLLEREAEPLAALASLEVGGHPGGRYPAEEIDLAWRHLLSNQPHDSLCGCSIDAVHEDMRFRYAQARGIGENIARDAAALIASRVDCSLASAGDTVLVAVNAGPARRGALLSFPASSLPALLVDREGRSRPAQPAAGEAGSAVFFDERFTPRQLAFVMGMVKHGKLLEFSVQDARTSWETSSVLRIDLELAEQGYSRFDWDAWVRSARPLLSTPGLAQVHAVGMRSGTKTVIFQADLPSFGARAFALRRGDPGPPTQPGLRAGRNFLENPRYRVRVLRDGSLEVQDRVRGLRLRGANRIVDAGDRGDEYDFDSPPRDSVVQAPRSVRTQVVERGPVRATLRIRSLYRLPAALRPDRRSREKRKVDVEVVRWVSLLAEGDRIELRTEIDNTVRDHRMRVHFPLSGPSSQTQAGGTFGAVRRPAGPEPFPPRRKRPTSPELGEEEPFPTHPFTGFVACAGGGAFVAVLARGMREYELVPGGRELAITLLRSVGWLSRADLATRRGNAGPDTATPGAQETGRHLFEYALLIGHGEPDEAALSRAWEDYRATPRAVLRAAGPGDLGDAESLMEIADDGLVFSSLRRRPDGSLSLRLFDARGEAREALLRFSRPVAWARKTRIDGTVVSPLPVRSSATGAIVPVPVEPWGIITVEYGGTA